MRYIFGGSDGSSPCGGDPPRRQKYPLGTLGHRSYWFRGALMGALSLCGAASASPSASEEALEARAQAEYSLVAKAVQVRLDRERVGDSSGARLAASDAETHRARFLELSRDIERLLSPLPPSLSVAVSGLTSGPSPRARAPSDVNHIPEVSSEADPIRWTRSQYREWDMYRPRAPALIGDTHDRVESGADHLGPGPQAVMASAGDLYSRSSVSQGQHAVVPREVSARAETGEAPRTPFLVYRDRPGADDTREYVDTGTIDRAAAN